MAKEKPLAPMAQRFAWEYPIDCNGTAAAIRAGYSPKTAKQMAYKLLQDPRVKAAIKKAQADVAERAGLSAVMVAVELKRIAFADMTDFVEWGPQGVTLRSSNPEDDDDADDRPPVDGRVVAEVSESITEAGGSKRIKLHDKLGAIGQLTKMFGWNAPEKQEVSGPNGGPMQVEVNDAKQRLAERLARLKPRPDSGSAG
jgi:phage terminase small subunit